MAKVFQSLEAYRNNARVIALTYGDVKSIFVSDEILAIFYSSVASGGGPTGARWKARMPSAISERTGGRRQSGDNGSIADGCLGATPRCGNPASRHPSSSRRSEWIHLV